MKRGENFQVFIISRFLVMLIFVVMSEFLVFFAMGFVHRFGMDRFPIVQFLTTLFLYTVPIVVAAVWFAKIVTEEVERINQLEEDMRLQYERSRNLMLSDIAHDLRTPITTIAGYSKALNDDMIVSEEKKREYLQAIENKSARMNDLINLLFDYVRLDSANYGLRRDEMDLPELLRTIAASLYSDVEEKGMEFEISIPEEVHMVSLDRVQFSRVVVNLINNAIKHNKAGTTISLEMKLEKNSTQVVISDNGGLIPEFLAEHIFEPFAMGDASRTTQSGSGLGLSIAKKIVEMHGWTIELKQYYEDNRKAFVIEIK